MKDGEIYASTTFVAVHAYIHNEKGEVFLLQRAQNNRYRPLNWDMPGGKIQAGESAEMALSRELNEETGFRLISVNRPLCVFVNTEQLPVRQDVQIVFDCTVEVPDVIVLSPNEHRQSAWVSTNCLNSMECMPYLRYFCEKVLNI